MSEPRLREFAARAEELLPLPDPDVLERRGRRLRVRRRAGAAGVLVAALAVAGIVALDQRALRADEPVLPPPSPEPSAATPWPDASMRTVPAGTYEDTLMGAVGPLAFARFTLPAGWNSWIGPNRFEGQRPAGSNDDVVNGSTWYAGVLILDVYGVATTPCQSADPHFEYPGTASGLVSSLTRIQGLPVARGPEAAPGFGYPATHVRLAPTRTTVGCDADAVIFDTGSGTIPVELARTDLYVVDVDGLTVVVVEVRTPGVPARILDELGGVVDSIQFRLPAG